MMSEAFHVGVQIGRVRDALADVRAAGTKRQLIRRLQRAATSLAEAGVPRSEIGDLLRELAAERGCASERMQQQIDTGLRAATTPDLRIERRDYNERRWCGRDGWKAPEAHFWQRRLRYRTVLIIGAVPALGVSPERLGLGAWLVVYGDTVLDAGITVAEARDIPAMREWAAAHPVRTAVGERPWRVLDLVTFGCQVLLRLGYNGRRPIVGIDLLRTFGLFAQTWWRPGSEYPQFRNGFALGLAGFGRPRFDADGLQRRGSAGWSQDFGAPILRAATRGARSVEFKWGPGRPYVTKTVDATTGKVVRVKERRGQWGDNRSWPGEFVDLLGVADTFDGEEHIDPARHLVAYGLDPISPQAVHADGAGAEHITALVHASHQLMVRVDDEAPHWCADLDLSKIWSVGTVFVETVLRMNVRPPLAGDGLPDHQIDAWCRPRHGGLVRSVRTTGPVPAEDRDIRHAHPVGAHAIDWLHYLNARRLRPRHVVEQVRPVAAKVADAAARHDFRRVKRLITRPALLRQFGCTRVVLQAGTPPYPWLPIELYKATGVHGHLVIHPCAGDQLDATFADYLAAVIRTSAANGTACVFEVLDAVRLVPVGRTDKLQPVTMLDNSVDLTIDDPAVIWSHLRTTLKQQGGPEHRRRAAFLRGLDNSGIGQLGRFDGTAIDKANAGPFCAPWLYTSIVSIPRLLLAIVEADIVARGGAVLSVDTDGIMLASSPCGGESVVLLDGRSARALSWEESDDVFAGFERLAVDGHDGSLWDVLRDHDGIPLLGRSFNPKRYVLGHYDNRGGFVVVKHTEHNLPYVAPATRPGRRPDGRMDWTADVAGVHAEYDGTELLGDFGWDADHNRRWPRLERLQLGTWHAFHAIAPDVGVRPGSHVVEASPLYRGTHVPRPIGADPGDNLDDWQHLDWHDAHTGQRISISTDADDLDAVQVVSLRATAVDWGRPRQSEDLPDVILVDRSCAHGVVRRGVALTETTEAPEDTIDAVRVIKDAYGRLGAERFKQVTGVSVDAAKKLGQRTPRTEKAARIVEALISGDDQSHPLTVKRGNTDPNALARFADKAAAARRRCSFGDCTKPIPPRCRYCPEHRAVARRIKDRNRQRADRQRKNEK